MEDTSIACNVCHHPFRTLKLLQAHRTQAHANDSTSALPFQCRNCHVKYFGHRETRRRHENLCTAAAIAPQPLGADEEEDSSGAEDTDADSFSHYIADIGDIRWTLASIGALESDHRVPAGAITKIIDIIRCRERFVRKEAEEAPEPTIPDNIRTFSQVRDYCDLVIPGHARLLPPHGEKRSVPDPSDVSTLRKRSRSIQERMNPSFWYTVDIVALITDLYRREWRKEIAEMNAKHAQESARRMYSSVRDGSVFQTSEFFRLNPEAAALALYCDGASLGDVRGKLASFDFAFFFNFGNVLIVCRNVKVIDLRVCGGHSECISAKTYRTG